MCPLTRPGMTIVPLASIVSVSSPGARSTSTAAISVPSISTSPRSRSPIPASMVTTLPPAISSFPMTCAPSSFGAASLKPVRPPRNRRGAASPGQKLSSSRVGAPAPYRGTAREREGGRKGGSGRRANPRLPGQNPSSSRACPGPRSGVGAPGSLSRACRRAVSRDRPPPPSPRRRARTRSGHPRLAASRDERVPGGVRAGSRRRNAPSRPPNRRLRGVLTRPLQNEESLEGCLCTEN